MEIVTLITLVIVLAIISMMYNTNYILTMLLSLEVILLNLTVFNIYLSFENSNLNLTQFSIFILTLSAVEASIGISLIALLSRNFSSANVDSLNTLKN
uniref:NADH-ubiquinone oxidoreductase chain 4L n=1 Tax=Ophiopholis mirabilis TaxID=2705304 RepID=A0A6C0FFT5_9ECHI|nr:NADH dehydrogenase subunit 4L [Ophiopholis mirabilis]QHT54261.1 NADH dehydrogenase subunit 4L [Ophiopholis mirabilis]UFQ25352.1 NADH dehydrogenase subunit 4L [Ophiopholis mirabilis]